MKERINPVLGHKAGPGTKSFCVYTVYDNRTDFPVVVDCEARECAAAMGITLASFYCAVVRSRSGEQRRWHIEKCYLDDVMEEGSTGI